MPPQPFVKELSRVLDSRSFWCLSWLTWSAQPSPAQPRDDSDSQSVLLSRLVRSMGTNTKKQEDEGGRGRRGLFSWVVVQVGSRRASSFWNCSFIPNAMLQPLLVIYDVSKQGWRQSYERLMQQPKKNSCWSICHANRHSLVHLSIHALFPSHPSLLLSCFFFSSSAPRCFFCVSKRRTLFSTPPYPCTLLCCHIWVRCIMLTSTSLFCRTLDLSISDKESWTLLIRVCLWTVVYRVKANYLTKQTYL